VRIAYVVGARPNIVKMAPVVARLRERLDGATHVVVHTGQHYDDSLSGVFMRELGMSRPDHFLGVGSGTHAQQTARAMERLEGVLMRERPDLVVIAGDVNSTLAAALAAVKLRLPVAHVESGLRSFDRTMPEEINRIVADQFSDYLFAHSGEAVDNLRREGIHDDRVHLVGNTMIDTLFALEPRFRNADTAARLGVRPGEFVLVTLHRPAITDDPALLESVLRELAGLAAELPVLFPLHPRTRAAIGSMPVGGVVLLGPLGYVEFLSLEASARGVITDSGGVQEETTFLGVPCFTLRANTERPVTVRIGTNTVIGLEPSGIATVLPALDRPQPRREPPPLWDGKAAVRLAEVVAAAVGDGRLGVA
jgi:UDP-N-acetylglucosamine 2-epimerase (non-hydrolysing)